MKKSDLYVAFILICGTVLAFLAFVHPKIVGPAHEKRIEEERRLVRELRITDMCLFTEARYTRHISQADTHAPFQDHPMSFEHFPSGSIVKPPFPLFRVDTGTYSQALRGNNIPPDPLMRAPSR